MRTFLKIMAVIVIVILLILSGWYYYLSILQAQVDNKIQELAQKGIPITSGDMHDYYYAKPLKQNAADLFVKAFDIIQEPSEDIKDVLPLEGVGELPLANAKLSPEQTKAIATYLETNQKTMSLLRQAALIPDFCYPVDPTLGFETLLPYLSQVRTANHLFCLEALLAIENNNPDAAVESLITAAQISKFCNNDIFLIGQLVTFANYNKLALILQRLFYHCQLSDYQLQQLRQILILPRDQKQFARCFYGEIYSFWQAIHNPDISSAGFNVDKLAYYLYQCSGVWHDDVLFYLNHMQARIAFFERPQKEWLAKIKAGTLKTNISKYYLLSNSMIPTLDTVGIKELECLSRASNYQAAIAIERFRLKYSKLPAQLSQLVPEFLDKVPIDLFSNQPIHYLLTEKGYKVYSVGYNEQNDQGSDEREDGEILDIVFSVEKK